MMTLGGRAPQKPDPDMKRTPTTTTTTPPSKQRSRRSVTPPKSTRRSWPSFDWWKSVPFPNFSEGANISSQQGRSEAQKRTGPFRKGNSVVASPNDSRGKAVDEGQESRGFYGSCSRGETQRSSTFLQQEQECDPQGQGGATLSNSKEQFSRENGIVISSPGKAIPQDSQDMTITKNACGTEISSPGIEPEVMAEDTCVLPQDLWDGIVSHLDMVDVTKLRTVNKDFCGTVFRSTFHGSRGSSEGEFSPMFFITDDSNNWHWWGCNTETKEWTRLPSLNCMPSPDPDLFKDYLVAGAGGLLCMNVGKAPDAETLIVCNPLTQQVKNLPPLKHRRHPVLMHLRMEDSGHYKVLVAGSATIGTESVSRKTEEYDSRTGEWTEMENLPYPEFGLNEYQNGAYYKDSEKELLLCGAILDTSGKGILMYDFKKKQWAQDPIRRHVPLVRGEVNVSHLATTQVVECGGGIFVFSEQECGKDVYFCIHKLNLDCDGDMWEEIRLLKRTGGRGLLVYPEFTCVPVSAHELCIFNTVEHTMEIINLHRRTEVITPIREAPRRNGSRFHSLNPIGFVFKPSFKSKVCPSGTRCLEPSHPLTKCSECQRRVSD